MTALYPVAYRGDAGSQSQPQPQPQRPNRRPVGKPANDNPRPLPKPANDNRAPVPFRARSGSAWSFAGRAGARLIPWLGVALTAYELWQWYNQEQPVGLFGNNPNGWTMIDSCASPIWPPTDPRQRATNTVPMCLTNQAAAAAQKWGEPLVAPATRLEKLNQHNDLPRWQVVEHWRRTDASTKPVQAQAQDILSIPAIEPFAIPIGVPVEIMPTPYELQPQLHRPNPNDITGHSTERGYGTNATTQRVFHPGPPGPGVRERKVRVRNIFLGTINFTTEGIDFMDALYYALPAHLREPNASVTRRGQLVYQHINEIDVAQAIENLIYNEIQDRVIGAMSQPLQQYARDNGLLFGFQAGPAL